MAGIGRADRVTLGDWNAVCFECGRKRKASTMKKNWQGYWVCPEHWEPRHPQDFVRALPDNQTPPWVQPPADCFIGFCTPCSTSAVTDLGVADCAIADYLSPACDEIIVQSRCTYWDDYDTTWDNDGTVWDCDWEPPPLVVGGTNWDDGTTFWDEFQTLWDVAAEPGVITPESFAPAASVLTHVSSSSYSVDYTGVPAVPINAAYALAYYQLIVSPVEAYAPVIYLATPTFSVHFDIGLVPGYTWSITAAALLYNKTTDTYFQHRFTTTPTVTITL